MEANWKLLLNRAYKEAEKSKNPSTQNGAVLVNSDGKILVAVGNTLTSDGVKETAERNIKPLRHKFSVHSERNAIYKAAEKGIKTNGLTMVCPWAACSECAQAIIQSGIKRLVVHKQALNKNGSWAEEVEISFTMMREAGVDVVIYDGEVGNVKVLRSGEYWQP